MATVLELRTSLIMKGYSTTESTPEQLLLAPKITVHTHPLLLSPVVLIGADVDTALEYQTTTVTAAIQRR